MTEVLQKENLSLTPAVSATIDPRSSISPPDSQARFSRADSASVMPVEMPDASWAPAGRLPFLLRQRRARAGAGFGSGAPGESQICVVTPDLPHLPPDASDPSAKKDSTQAPTVSEVRTILIADDDAIIRESLAAVLRSEKYQVQLAENGRIAVRQFLDGPPDLILLDLNMPDTDGWQAFEIMARLAPYVPVIVITARPYQARRAAEAGIDMLFEKPLEIPVLLETVRNLLAAPEQSRLAKVLRDWHTNDLPGTEG